MKVSSDEAITKLLGSQSKGKKEKIMSLTKKEMAMFNELMGTIKGLQERIDGLEKALGAKSSTSRTKTVEAKASKEPVEKVVGNLIFSGKYVKTGTGYMSSKTRYAIGQRILELGGTKLAKGNAIFDKCHKKDKYVQVYEFKTQKDCDNFRKEQEKRVG